MSRPALVAVAHGSKDPAAKETIAALAREVVRFAPVLDVRVAFIQHAEPSLDDELSAAGENAVIVPLLLSAGYHLATDIRWCWLRPARPTRRRSGTRSGRRNCSPSGWRCR
jgi:sirohydrochlorin ferrochelatase